MDSPHILILGAGSAGKRHARNLRALGCRVSAFDPREDIASPPVFHVDQVLAIAARQRALDAL